jgi:arylsulfatase A-like enzyme
LVKHKVTQQGSSEEGAMKGLFVAIVGLLCLSHAFTLAAKENKKYNILFIITDDEAYSDIGYRDATFHTPTLDGLANAGVKLERFYAQTSCSPTRAALMTGLYTHAVEMGEQFPLNHGDNRTIPLDLTFFPQYLRSEGYHTVGFGKWHLGMKTVEHLPTSRGFDYFIGNMDAQVEHYLYQVGFACTSGKDPYCGIDNGLTVLENGRPVTEYIGKNVYFTELIAEKAVNQIVAHDASQPLFMYFAPAAPHGPLQAPQRYIDSCSQVVNPPNTTENGRTMICAKLAAVDEAVLNITNALKQKGMYEDTIIIYMSDNGGIIDNGAINGNFRGQKASFFEGGVRTPAFISGVPLTNNGCTSFDGMVHVTDLSATVLKLAGSAQFDKGHGFPLYDADLAGCPSIDRTELELGVGGRVYARGSSAVVFRQNDRLWKYTRVPDIMTKYFGFSTTYTNATYLFDLTNDPQETTNLLMDLTHHEACATAECKAVVEAQLKGMSMTLNMEKESYPTFLDLYGDAVVYTPTDKGCWLPMDSEYRDTDCQLSTVQLTFPVPPPQFD